MSHRLVQSFLDRDVVWNGDPYLIRSPKVREALQVIAAAPGTAKGDEIDSQIFFEAIEGWLPEKLHRTLVEHYKGGDSAINRVVAFVFSLVNQGVPQFQNATDGEFSNNDDGEHETGIEWENVVAEYMHTFGCSLDQVLNEPWNSFLLMGQKTDMVHSRQMLRTMRLRSVPYIKDDGEREQAVAEIIARSNGTFVTKSKEQKRAEALEKQQGQLDALAAVWQPFTHGESPQNEA